MPAIRLIGEDMKPQAFDVYSPKILAAIAGLEDILASRCIAIPMRRTDKKLPPFPPDFDGAGLRHQLYTLALTHFRTVYANYSERPALHTLHNRSGELWSPLVALATSSLLLGAKTLEEGRLWWGSIEILAGALLAWLFVRVERRAHSPILPLSLFEEPAIARAAPAGVLIGGVLFSAVAFVPLYLRAVILRVGYTECGKAEHQRAEHSSYRLGPHIHDATP